jgi:diphthamide biosynthesis enzyme Dph1/Dph2-like protein
VALQFPDEFLTDAVAIVHELRALCAGCSFYILADTTVDLDVDFVAAAHVGADAIVHVGDSSVSRTASIPVLFIHPRRELELGTLTAKVTALIDPSKGLLCYFDPAYSHLFDDVVQQLHSSGVARVLIVARRSEVPSFLQPSPASLEPLLATCHVGMFCAARSRLVSCRTGRERSAPSARFVARGLTGP